MQVLVVGRSGNGLSSIVSSIQKVEAQDESLRLNVVEVKGVGDTGEDLFEDITNVLSNIEREVIQCVQQGGLKAVLFVIKYGTRYTQQEKKAVERVKDIFGESVFRKFGVLVFTYGDMFMLDSEGESFIDWCRKQTGDIQLLFHEVQYRCVLFDNKTADPRIQENQLTILMNCVQKIDALYTMADFEQAKKNHREIKRLEKPHSDSYSSLRHDAIHDIFSLSWTLVAIIWAFLCILSIEKCHFSFSGLHWIIFVILWAVVGFWASYYQKMKINKKMVICILIIMLLIYSIYLLYKFV